MLNVTGRFVTVYSPTMKLEVSDKVIFADLVTSKKERTIDENGKERINYVNMTWKGRFVGQAAQKVKDLNLSSGTKIAITKGFVENKYYKEKNFLSLSVTVLDFELENVGGNNNNV